MRAPSSRRRRAAACAHVQERVHVTVDRGDAVEVSLRRLHTRDLSRSQPIGQRGGGQTKDVVAHCSVRRLHADGVPEDLATVTGCLTDIVEASARDYPDAVALEFFRRETTYRALHEQISRAAAGLATLGVRAGDRAARRCGRRRPHRRAARSPARTPSVASPAAAREICSWSAR
ncbi:AMP-binding protein [Ralstonia pickettii]|uniref:AMP-binding protein n=1 Tax=Ralstonia pickettii TaxID=329 RepID=UPI0034D1F295